ncbi:MAG: Hsp20 family protein [Myxococcota bacterium]|nr:Hsp20 family protein [Myxococcota bacterium]
MGNAVRVRHTNHGPSVFDAFDKRFAPFFQQSVGFDRVFDTMNKALREATEGGSYPPYDIVQDGENDYTITLAIAGFAESDIEITLDNGVLSITGAKPMASRPDTAKFLHRGIAHRKFQHRFRLSDHIEVTEATIKNGLLNVHLHRELPEALKPRTIRITSN